MVCAPSVRVRLDLCYKFKEGLRQQFNNKFLNLTLFLPGEGGISPLIVCHVTPPGRNRVKSTKEVTLKLVHAIFNH